MNNYQALNDIILNNPTFDNYQIISTSLLDPINMPKPTKVKFLKQAEASFQKIKNKKQAEAHLSSLSMSLYNHITEATKKCSTKTSSHQKVNVNIEMEKWPHPELVFPP